jgi:hypothetical protein
MNIKRDLVAALLAALCDAPQREIREQDLFLHVNVLRPEAIPGEELRHHLNFAKDQGWVKRRVDSFDTAWWRVTQEGRLAREEET